MRSNRLFWLLVLLVGAGVLAIAVRHETGSGDGLRFDDGMSVLVKLVMIVVVGSAAYAMFYGRLGDALKAAAFWVVVASVLALGYTYRHEVKIVGERVLVELAPGYAASRPGTVPTVHLARSREGEFSVRAELNGRRVPMIVDTGASSVVLTVEAAKAAGLPLEFLRYDVVVETANGRTKAAAVTVDRLVVGSIVARRVPALVAEQGDLRTSLLGMSFLNRLESYEVRGDRLVMRGRPST